MEVFCEKISIFEVCCLNVSKNVKGVRGSLYHFLTLPVPLPDEEKKFRLFFDASKGFMKAFKGLHKTFEAPERSVKMKI